MWDIKLITDEEIFNVTTPEDHVGGPYFVVQKEGKDNGIEVIVLLDWMGKPRFGKRLFNEGKGEPLGRKGVPIWGILEEPNSEILDGVSFAPGLREIFDDFLSGNETKLTGAELLNIYNMDKLLGIARCKKYYRNNIVNICDNAAKREKESHEMKEKLKTLKERLNARDNKKSAEELAEEIGID